LEQDRGVSLTSSRGTPSPVATDTAPRLEGLRVRWTLAFVVGELVGFVPPAVTGAVLATR
jgi:hypothetical protein